MSSGQRGTFIASSTQIASGVVPAVGSVTAPSLSEWITAVLTTSIVDDTVNTDPHGTVYTTTPITIVTASEIDVIKLKFGATITGTARVAVYNSAAGVPTTLVFESGDTPITAVSDYQSFVFATKQALAAGVYHLAFQTSGAAHVRYLNGGAASSYQNQAYGAFPANFVATATVTKQWQEIGYKGHTHVIL